MELRTRFRDLRFGLILLLSSCFLIYESRKLNGYKFPVYSTKHCPRNQTEWNERSSAINCTTENGYVCLPNENITELLEFCYTYPFILIQEGICLYLSKRYSAVDSYSCTSFISGCPNTSFVSYNLFKNPPCTSIGNGCFLAEPSCQSVTSTSYLPDITEKKRLDDNKDWILFAITFLVLIIIFFAVVRVIFINPKMAFRNLKRRKDVEEREDEEVLLQFASHNQQDISESRFEELPLDKVLFKRWQEDNKQFVETKASREVEGLIKCQNIVIVTGHTGCGKSAIVHHVALKYRSQDIRDSATSRETYNLALELCEMKKNTAPHSIGDAFETLQGYFVKKSGDTYQFYHDFVMEVTTFVFGTDYPLKLIQYADIAFLRKKM
uniref:Novel STAND NTPase 3 domain-containing protein n=1 Tax=Magallana gigas TaxID=29159 RepID=A0A8W8NYJ4_MAGGI